MRGVIHPFSQYVFIAWCLVKHRDNFTFSITDISHGARQYFPSYFIKCSPHQKVFQIQFVELFSVEKS